MDEGGWDDFDIENNTAMVTPTKDAPVKEISDKKPVELKKEAPAVVKKMENSLDEGDWDDWGDETTQKKSDEFGCTDWSLIDEKKVKEATLKKETDPWVQEQTTRKTEKKTSGWGWGGLVSAVGLFLSLNLIRILFRGDIHFNNRVVSRSSISRGGCSPPSTATKRTGRACW